MQENRASGRAGVDPGQPGLATSILLKQPLDLPAYEFVKCSSDMATVSIIGSPVHKAGERAVSGRKRRNASRVQSSFCACEVRG